jgi:putative two-component system response regulator
MTYKLLIVDDEKANLRLLERLFSRDYYCLTASSGLEAIRLLEQHDVAIVITDQRMPEITGIDLLKQTAALRPHMARILLTGYTDVEALAEAINCGLVHMYITKPWNNDDLKRRVGQALEQYENNKKQHALRVANERLEARLKEMKLGLAYALAEMLRARDEYSSAHASRVSQYVTAIAERLQVSEEERADLDLAASLHNIGHIGTPGRLLRNAELLNPEEMAVYRKHIERGARILATVPELGDVANIIRFQTENFDGSGFPRGLRGEQIPLACRVIRAADQYDSMTQPRTAAAAIDQDQAIDSLYERAGKELDPQIVKALVLSLADDDPPEPGMNWESMSARGEAQPA